MTLGKALPILELSTCFIDEICYNRGMKKVGIDIHGVITNYSKFFKELSRSLYNAGHEIHIVTGEPEATARPTVDEADVVFTHFFSIVDYHVKNQTPSLRQDENGKYWVDDEEWNKTKGDYAQRVGLDMHFDDQAEYAEFFPKNCSFIHVPPENFNLMLDNIVGI